MELYEVNSENRKMYLQKNQAVVYNFIRLFVG